MNLVIVTGMSGAGRSTTMKMLEDIVWEKFEETKTKEHIKPEDEQKYIDGINYELQIIKDTNEQIHTCDYFLFNTKPNSKLDRLFQFFHKSSASCIGFS